MYIWRTRNILYIQIIANNLFLIFYGALGKGFLLGKKGVHGFFHNVVVGDECLAFYSTGNNIIVPRVSFSIDLRGRHHIGFSF